MRTYRVAFEVKRYKGSVVDFDNCLVVLNERYVVRARIREAQVVHVPCSTAALTTRYSTRGNKARTIRRVVKPVLEIPPVEERLP